MGIRVEPVSGGGGGVSPILKVMYDSLNRKRRIKQLEAEGDYLAIEKMNAEYDRKVKRVREREEEHQEKLPEEKKKEEKVTVAVAYRRLLRIIE